jgi:hypothetical protein
MDNWGWCAGFCDTGDEDTDECYTGYLDDGSTQDECDITYCPSEGESSSCEDFLGGSTNPWVNFSGTVVITP